MQNLVQGLGGNEGFGVDLVDVLGAGWAGGEPVVPGGYLDAPDFGPVARSLGQLGSDGFAGRPSGTENIYKVYAESFVSPEALEQVLDDADQVVAKALG